MAVLSVMMQLALIAYWVVRQYPSNHNLSGYLIPFVQGVVAPVIFFISAYLARQRQPDSRAKWFDSALFTAIGILAADIITQSTVFYQQSYVLKGGYWQSVFYDLLPLAVTYLLYLTFLLRYRS